jgi:hypothetical protein
VADTHFRLAQLLQDSGDSAAAKRHVLLSLEEAPRFLAAHKLLLELVPDDVAEESQGDSNPLAQPLTETGSDGSEVGEDRGAGDPSEAAPNEAEEQ